jgi:hypothetical protein
MSTATDNIFINKYKNKNYIIYPWINGLSDHEGQIMTIYNVTYMVVKDQIHTHRIINESSILDFQINISYELWDDIFTDSDVDTMFNNFFNTFLRIFNSSFRISKSRTTSNNKLWVTSGIKKSCVTKRELYIKTRNNNEPSLKAHYKEYCNILNRVILTAKKLYFNKIIATSNNKARTTWKVIRNATGNDHVPTNTTCLKITSKNTQNYQDTVNSFNNFFLDVANITKEGINKDMVIDKRPFQKKILKETNRNEIEEIIRLMKPKLACGYDGITAKLIKVSAPFTLSPYYALLPYPCDASNMRLYLQSDSECLSLSLLVAAQ